MNVVLMGYRGCGKTTIGRSLADELGLEFVDVDDTVCERFDVGTITEIFEAHSEAAFREMEARVVFDLIERDGRVIALGGGSVMNADSRKAIEAARDATRVYLKCAVEELFRRTQTDRKFTETRPKQNELGGSVQRIAEVLATREPVYTALADIIVDVTECPIERVVESLAQQVRAGS